mgnify:CR=1 FL=1
MENENKTENDNKYIDIKNSINNIDLLDLDKVKIII